MYDIQPMKTVFRSFRYLCLGLLLALVPMCTAAQTPDSTATHTTDSLEAQLQASAEDGHRSAAIPASFRGVGDNVIQDFSEHLYPIFMALLDISEGEYLDSLRVMHIGDSHIRGHIYPQTFGQKLAGKFGAVRYRDLGINGATFSSYMRSDKLNSVYAWQPDLVIISFGTNEAYDTNYSPERHYRQIDELVVALQENLPYTCLLFTTPAGCYLRGGRHNPNNERCAQTLINYARDHGLAIYDLFAASGGPTQACSNWKRSGMMRPDGVHFTAEGYRTQGNMLFDAFIKAYEEALNDL